MDAKEEQREALRSVAWINNQVPEILTAAEAYALQGAGKSFYGVTWWETDKKPIPAGFTRFDFYGQDGENFMITWHGEPCDRDDIIPAHDWVVIFEATQV